MNTLVIICLIIVLYWRARNLYYKRLTLEYRFKLYRLRDQLRYFAIDGKIDKSNWVFNYMDTSISKTISIMDNMNLVFLIVIIIKNRNRKDLIEFNKSIETQVKLNKHLYDVYLEYGRLNIEFLMKKHYWIAFIAKSIGRSINAFGKIRNKFEFFASSIRVYPETSTSNSFCLK